MKSAAAQHVLEDQAVQPQDGARVLDMAERGQQLRRGWNTVRDVTVALRFPSEEACRTWLRRSGIVGLKRGRCLLIDGRDVERKLRGL